MQEMMNQLQRGQIYYMVLFCACRLASLENAYLFMDGRPYLGEEMRPYLPAWLAGRILPKRFRRYLFNSWGMHKISDYLIEGGFRRKFYKNDLFESLTESEARFIIRKLRILRNEIELSEQNQNLGGLNNNPKQLERTENDYDKNKKNDKTRAA